MWTADDQATFAALLGRLNAALLASEPVATR